MAYGACTPEFWVVRSRMSSARKLAFGLHVCFAAPNKAAVDAFHAAAAWRMAARTTANRASVRYLNYYGAFAVDPDGWRIEAYFGG